ncbi:MAG: hypothetical protein QM286_11610 [Acidobacteriota bacterium]|nr:hypothetical protein [Acidobacteriota bacterium]
MNPTRTRGRVLRMQIALLFAVTLGLLAGPTAVVARAQDPASECLADGGIYVYVFEQGTELLAGCSHAQTGLARLLELTAVQTAGQGFICQIDGRPDRCVATPAGDEPYWNYWWWRDGQWVYANIGASYRGVPGSIEAWHFSVSAPPPVSPGDTQPSTATPTEAAPPAVDDGGGLPGWAPTVITVAVIAAGGAGYALWRRKSRGD